VKIKFPDAIFFDAMVDVLRQPLRAYASAPFAPLPDEIAEFAVKAAAPSGIDGPVTGKVNG
jgi:hypothetical protein